MTIKHWILLILFIIDCLTLFVRGVIGHTKTYTASDAIGALIAAGLYPWLLLS